MEKKGCTASLPQVEAPVETSPTAYTVHTSLSPLTFCEITEDIPTHLDEDGLFVNLTLAE